MRDKPGSCPKRDDCVSADICGADIPNELCFEPKNIVVSTLED